MVEKASPELVIFDCDGVLVDSETVSARVFSETIADYGLSLDADEVDDRFRGRSLVDCQRDLERQLDRPLGDDFLRRLNDRTFEAFRHELQPVSGVRETLETISAAGLKTCVASSGSHEKMQLTLSLTGLLPLLKGRLFSASEVPRGKPAPDLVQHAASSLGVAPERCLVVEDSVLGARGALEAGMLVLGFADASKDRNQGPLFRKSGVTTFARMAELPGMLGL